MKYLLAVVLFLSMCSIAVAQSVPYTTLPGQFYQPQQYPQPSYQQPAVPRGRRSPLGSLSNPHPSGNYNQQVLQSLERQRRQRQAELARQREIIERQMRQQANQHNPSDPYGVKPHIDGLLGTPQQRRMWNEQWRRQDDIERRNYILQTGCHKYSRACLNELKSLGR